MPPAEGPRGEALWTRKSAPIGEFRTNQPCGWSGTSGSRLASLACSPSPVSLRSGQRAPYDATWSAVNPQGPVLSHFRDRWPGTVRSEHSDRPSHPARRAASVEGMHPRRPTLRGTPRRCIAAVLLVMVACTGSRDGLSTTSSDPTSTSPSPPSPTASAAPSPSPSNDLLGEGADSVRLTAPPGGSFLVRGTFPFVPSPCRRSRTAEPDGALPGDVARPASRGRHARAHGQPPVRPLPGRDRGGTPFLAGRGTGGTGDRGAQLRARDHRLDGRRGRHPGATDLRHHVVPGLPGDPRPARPRPSTVGPRRPAHRREGPARRRPAGDDRVLLDLERADVRERGRLRECPAPVPACRRRARRRGLAHVAMDGPTPLRRPHRVPARVGRLAGGTSDR